MGLFLSELWYDLIESNYAQRSLWKKYSLFTNQPDGSLQPALCILHAGGYDIPTEF